MTIGASSAHLRGKWIEFVEMCRAREGGDDEKSLSFSGQHILIFIYFLFAFK